MKLKGRGILVLCLLVFGGYAVYDYLGVKKSDEKKTTDLQLFSMNIDQIDSIEVKTGSQVIQLKRTVEGWNLLQPLQDVADDAAADDLIKMAGGDKAKDIAKEGSDIDWALYGLDQPEGSITFTNSAGTSSTLQISKKSNFENFPFARRDKENRVLVVNTAWTARLMKPVVEFRERRLLRHKIGAIENFRLKNKNGTLEISLKEGKWVSVGPKVDLDQQKVRELFHEVADAKAAEYVTGKLPALKSLFTLDLKLGDKNWKAEVGQAADKKIFATVSDPRFLLQMEPGAVDKLIDLKIEDLKVGSTPKDDSKESAQIAHEKDSK